MSNSDAHAAQSPGGKERGRTLQRGNGLSLHLSLSVLIVAFAILALAASVSLVLLTSYLHRSTVSLADALHGVRLAEEMELTLLAHARTPDLLTRSELESELRTKIRQAGQYVDGPLETQILNDAVRRIEEYFTQTQQRSVPDEVVLERAFSALRRLIDINVDQAEGALSESSRWDDLGDRIGIGVGLVLIFGTTIMLTWLMVAFRPVFAIRDALKAFAGGDRQARVPEHGPEELRSIAMQFNDMADALQRQNDNRLSFIAAVAHDLRTPLSALTVSTKILSSDRDLSHEKVRDLLSIVGRQVQRLDRMVGDLLDASRIEAGNLELRLQNCDAKTCAGNVLDLFRPAHGDRRLSLKAPEEPVVLRCDQLRIEQVLANLVSNAIKYSPGGSAVEVQIEQKEDQIVLAVRDRGMGIPESELPYIFEPFRRARISNEDIPGVGLGLSVAQRIVKAHQGHIEVSSAMDEGTTFRVYLPLDPGRVPAGRLTAA